MHATRRGFLRGLVAVAAATALPMSTRWTETASAAPIQPATLPSSQSTPANALVFQAANDTEWTELLSGVSVSQIFTPSSGALLARTADSLLRSDDAGASWRPLPLADPKPSYVTVDPTNHDTLYVATDTAVQRSDDAGQTWTTLLQSAHPSLAFRRITISPADPRIIFATQYDYTTMYQHRSMDGGATWEQILDWHGNLCGMSIYIFQPHPTDPSRVFRTAGCYAGRNIGDELEQSLDTGSTFKTLAAPRGSFPSILVGGSGADPLLFYLASNKDFRSGGSMLQSSPDDGATWTTVLEYSGGGAMQGAKDPSTTITGLAYDPAAPQRVFLSHRVTVGSGEQVGTHTAISSTDSGVSWSPLGSQQLPKLHQLALGIDGRNLFAASAQGVLRIAVG